MTWRWLVEGVVIAMHGEQISEHGGSLGIRDAGRLSSVLARPQNQAAYGDPSVLALATNEMDEACFGSWLKAKSVIRTERV